ncbi:hypothetical protein QBC36DRAFT_308477 [Triangularia setosa]|uniref:Uncharacterized protein n=1 Tax=Triangularia setosa TaxID=2587417 RepID=A0AAN6WCC9_9PEZI|nr:hypothetical protein QBC36DRAFT_308477 [Podospora setosa]
MLRSWFCQPLFLTCHQPHWLAQRPLLLDPRMDTSNSEPALQCEHGIRQANGKPVYQEQDMPSCGFPAWHDAAQEQDGLLPPLGHTRCAGLLPRSGHVPVWTEPHVLPNGEPALVPVS